MIYLNLIPRPLWYLNLRSLLSNEAWKKLSLKIRTEQNWTCQACKISLERLKFKKYFHCHEMWDFNDETLEVNLLCLITLCSHCHMATHFGFSSVKNLQDQSFKQIMKVNKWDKQTTEYYLEGCFEEFMRRSNKQWKINFLSFEPFFDSETIEMIKQKVATINKDDCK